MADFAQQARESEDPGRLDAKPAHGGEEQWEAALPPMFVFGPPPSDWPEQPSSFARDLARFHPQSAA